MIIITIIIISQLANMYSVDLEVLFWYYNIIAVKLVIHGIQTHLNST